MARDCSQQLREEGARRQRLEQALALSEQRFQALSFATATINWASDADGQVVADQPSWRAFTGQRPEEVLGWGWLDAVHPDDRDGVEARWRQAIAEHSFYEGQYRLRRADGAYRWIWTRSVPILGPRGQIREWVAACTDITEHKRAREELEWQKEHVEAELAKREAALRQREALFEAFMDHNPSIASMRDEEGRFVYLSPTFERFFGIPAEEMLGKPHPPWITAEEAAQIERNNQAVMQADQPLTFEEHLTDREGKLRIWLSLKFPFRLPNGTRYLGASALDLTDMKRQEAALRESERRLRQAQAIARIGSFEWDLETGAITWSDEEYRLFGVTPNAEPLTNTIIERYVHPEDRMAFRRAMEGIAQKHEPLALDFRVVHPDGTILTLHEQLQVLRDEHGTPTRIAGTSQDVTRQRAAERELERLRRLERREFEVMVQRVKDYAIYMVDPQGRIMTWNAGAEAISGYDEHEILGQPISRFHVPEDVAEGKVQLLLERAREAGSLEDDGWRIRKNGERFWAHTVVTAVHDQDRFVGFVKVVRDMTEPRRHEAIARELAALSKLDRMKDDFLSMISHELRTPLNFITGFASILDDEAAGPLNPTQHLYLDKILHGADRLLFHVNNLVEMSRLSAGKLSIHPAPTDYGTLVASVLESFRPIAENQQIALEAEVQVHGEILIDGQHVIQVLRNLVDNAVKFTPEGGKVMIKAYPWENLLVTEVSDTGVGIAPEDLPKLFQRFVQLDMTSTRSVGGAGLGLSISKSIVEAHGGSVGVRSEGPGMGSTFWFSLPLEREDGEI